MRPGLEEMFNHETAEFFDRSIPYAVRLMKWRRLIRVQEGLVRSHNDGSITTPIDPDDRKDAAEYLERLRKISLPT